MPYYSPGAWDLLGLPRDYWMIGYLAADPAVSHRILLDRHVRCGIFARGFFTSSPITGIKGDLITTYNSVWRLSQVPVPHSPAVDDPAAYVRIIIVRRAVHPRPSRQQALADGAWLEGTLTNPVKIGDVFRLRCVLLNGRASRRVYQSSPVVLINGDEVTTEQLEYKILRVPTFNPERSSWASEE